MSRSYANIMTAIWRDADFIALPANAQRVYLMLVTQPDISSCGLLSLTVKRWAGYAPDTPSDALSDALSALSARAFLVIDWDAEEVLIRSFVRHDGGYRNGKRLPAILGAVDAIMSGPLRQVMAHELNRLGVRHSLSDRPCDALSDRASDRPRYLVTTQGESLQPTTLKPQPESLVPSRNARGARLPDDWQPMERLVQWVRNEYPAVNGAVETAKFRDYWHSKSGKDATKTDWDATFRNWIRNAAERTPSARASTPTTTERVTGWLDLADRFADTTPEPKEIAR